MEKDFASTLKGLRKERRLTQEALADNINKTYGVNWIKGMISKWENGHSASLDNIKLLSLYFNVSLNKLLAFNLKLEYKDKIPIVNSFSKGNSIYSKENIIDYAYKPPSFIDTEDSKSLFYYKVHGDTVNREIPENSMVLIKKTPIVKDGEIAVILLNEKDNIKDELFKIKFEENLLTLIPSSYNPDYLPKVIDLNKKNVKVVGKVIAFFSTLP